MKKIQRIMQFTMPAVGDSLSVHRFDGFILAEPRQGSPPGNECDGKMMRMHPGTRIPYSSYVIVKTGMRFVAASAFDVVEKTQGLCQLC